MKSTSIRELVEGDGAVGDLPPLIQPKVVAKHLGVSVRTLQRWVREGQFIVPVKLGPQRIGFAADELKEWQNARPRTRIAA